MAVVVAIGLSFLFNLLFTLSDLVGMGIAQQWSAGLGGMVIAPAAHGLAMWGAVYLGSLAMVVYLFRAGQTDLVSRGRWRQPLFVRVKVNRCLIGAMVGQGLWAGLFAARLWLVAAVVMVPVLGCLVEAYRGLEIGRLWTSARRTWLYYGPVSLYLGWASVVMVVTVATGLWGLGWRSGEMVWGLVVILALAMGSMLVILNYRDIWFGLAVAWGLGMIAMGQQGEGVINVVASLAVMGLVVCLTWVVSSVGMNPEGI